MVNHQFFEKQWLPTIDAPLSMCFPNCAPVNICEALLSHTATFVAMRRGLD
jgi:hypothetical protein